MSRVDLKWELPLHVNILVICLCALPRQIIDKLVLIVGLLDHMFGYSDSSANWGKPFCFQLSCPTKLSIDSSSTLALFGPVTPTFAEPVLYDVHHNTHTIVFYVCIYVIPHTDGVLAHIRVRTRRSRFFQHQSASTLQKSCRFITIAPWIGTSHLLYLEGLFCLYGMFGLWYGSQMTLN